MAKKIQGPYKLGKNNWAVGRKCASCHGRLEEGDQVLTFEGERPKWHSSCPAPKPETVQKPMRQHFGRANTR